jgi:hypothetical protein
MAKYKLLKDLPGLKKGTILSEGEPIFGVKTLITKNNDVGTTFIGNELFEELFEEIQEEPTDSIHWNPRIGDRCFILENANIKPTLYTGRLRDCNAWRTGKIFRTEEECEKARDRELAEARLRRTSTFEPDFENDNGGWVVFYNPREKKLETDEVYRFDYGEIVRYETEEEAQRSTEENREDWLTYFGIEEEK